MTYKRLLPGNVFDIQPAYHRNRWVFVPMFYMPAAAVSHDGCLHRFRFILVDGQQDIFEKLCNKTNLPSGFHFDGNDWLTYQSETESGDKSIPIKICSRLEVIARTRDQAGENHGRLLQFPDPDGIVHRWAMPMELLAGDGNAAAHNDCLLCLDEMGQIEPGELGKVAYMLANGTGKMRSDKTDQSRKQMRWRLIFLSSGEISLADHMLEAKMRSRAGQEVRVIDIPADDCKYGCFENLHGREQGKAFSEHLVGLCKASYGTPGLEFVNCLLTNQDKIIKDSCELMGALSKKYFPATASGQVSRVFNHFALIAVAGELATTFRITNWQEGAAIEAAMICFQD